MEKLIKGGNVAVLVSPRYGAGWSTWNSDHAQQLCMDKALAEFVLAGDFESVQRRALEIDPDVYMGGLDSLEVKWVPVGSAFRIAEYDGSESLVLIALDDYFVA